ncbi:MAG: Asp-tRNA(Asn)/Glu-tRNA(Gln) amidotransferase subunit GatB [Planctomycetes bacterium]|nr:Asp-tRNA(Asn)/Glu-tRNA(Gln) amidotransferase subunit GatB [Planctomycetota bacterium]
MEFRPTIGLETHVQLATQTKLFCGCANRFGAPPNTLICPVCSGQPGVLPVLNERALRLGVRAALALGATVANYTKFDRKHYFYPDLPKGYQISQYDLPFSSGGGIRLENNKFVRLRRIHLEEDAGKAIHDRGDGTLVDLNRAGVPLIEIVTEPDVASADEAYEYLTALKETLQFAGVSECDMEKGSLRCDVNVSVHPKEKEGFGTRCEVKNINSFAMVKKAIAFEIERQSKWIESGGRIVQETRTWRDDEGRTETLRTKEEAQDYRYFPEPDLPPLRITNLYIDETRAEIPESPSARRERFVKSGLNREEIQTLTIDRAAGDYYDQVAAACGDPKAAAVWVCGEVNRVRNEKNIRFVDFPLTPAQTASVIVLVKSGRASVSAGKQIFDALVRDTTKTAGQLLQELGLEQISDPAIIENAVREVLAANAKIVAEYKGGKEKALGSLMGQIMKKTGGRANPAELQLALKRLLER